MNIVTNPLTLSAAALALFLAGCGGSDDPPANDPDPNGDGNDTMMSDPTPMTPASDTLVNAIAQLRTLAGAADAAGSALKMASDADKKVTLVASQGVAMDAQSNAQAVLDAAQALRDQIAATTAARTAAQTAHDALSAGATKTALMNVIAEADMEIRTANALLAAARPGVTGSTLSVQVARYTGDDKTPADQGQHVAKAVQGIMKAPRMDSSLPTDTTVFADGTTRDSATMKTFAEWFADDLKDESRQGKKVKAISLEGLTSDGDGSGGEDAVTAAVEDLNRDSGVPYTHLGIAGHAICRSEDGACMVADGKLGKGWHFTPTKAADYWVVHANGSSYERAIFAEWGLWLTAGDRAETDVPYDNAAVNFFTTSTDVSGLKFDKAADDDEKTTASYSGSASGLSSRQTGTGDDATYASGHFNARVNLMATFTADPAEAALDGSIHTFTASGQGTTGHVDSAWRFNLNAATVSTGNFGQTTDAYDDRNVGGSWSLAPYGEDGKHPTGFYGHFHAMEMDKYNVFGTMHADK